MSMPTEVQLLVDHYTKNHLYGRLEFIFKGGDLVFIKKEETIVPSTEEVFKMRPDKERH